MTSLCFLQHQQDHLVDIAFGDGDQIVHELVEQGERQVAGVLDRNALGGRDDLIGLGHPSGGERVLPCRAAFRNGADHAHFRLERS